MTWRDRIKAGREEAYRAGKELAFDRLCARYPQVLQDFVAEGRKALVAGIRKGLRRYRPHMRFYGTSWLDDQ
jgi:hypothetical protein